MLNFEHQQFDQNLFKSLFKINKSNITLDFNQDFFSGTAQIPHIPWFISFYL